MIRPGCGSIVLRYHLPFSINQRMPSSQTAYLGRSLVSNSPARFLGKPTCRAAGESVLLFFSLRNAIFVCPYSFSPPFGSCFLQAKSPKFMAPSYLVFYFSIFQVPFFVDPSWRRYSFSFNPFIILSTVDLDIFSCSLSIAADTAGMLACYNVKHLNFSFG